MRKLSSSKVNRSALESMPLKIAVLGPGAIGAYYCSRLAKAGHEVHFVARSDYAAVEERGYEIREGHRSFRLHPARVHRDPGTIGKADLVVIALKSTANDLLPQLLPPLVDGHTMVLTLQNGLGNVEALSRIVPANQILGGLCFCCIKRVAPGVIECYMPGQIYIGEFLGTYRPRTMELVGVFEAAEIACYFSNSLDESLWKKLCWNIPFNGLCIAAGGVSTEQLLAQKPLVKLARALMEEVREAAEAHGHAIDDAFLDQQFSATRKMGAYQPSSLIDYLAGKPVEIEAIFGEPLKRGENKELYLPHLRSLYWLVKSLCAMRQSQPPHGQ